MLSSSIYIFTYTQNTHTHTHTKLKFILVVKNLCWRQMFTGPSVMSNNNNRTTHSLSDEAACSIVSSITRVHDFSPLNPLVSINISPTSEQHLADHKIKKKRNLPGNPDPDAEVIALSPKTLMATNRFVCEICNKGFQRDQNLQLHRRGHNLPWKLKQRNRNDIKKKAYVCPELTCVHHHPSRALGDLTGIKKHFCRKHGEKKWKCEKCSKIYAVQSDWKAHSKTCGTREYRCDCGTLFSRKDSFITHRAFCDALAEETARLSAAAAASSTNPLYLTSSPPPPPPPITSNPNFSQPSYSIHNSQNNPFTTTQHISNFPNPPPPPPPSPSPLLPWENPNPNQVIIKHEMITFPPLSSPFYQETPTNPTTHKNNFSSPYLHHLSTSAPHLSATALLQRAATVGSQPVGHVPSTMIMEELGSCHVTSTGMSQGEYMNMANLGTWQKSDRLTRDFLGLTAGGEHVGGGNGVDVNVNMNVRNLLTFAGGVGGFPTYERDESLLLMKTRGTHGFAFTEPHSASGTWGNC